MLVINFSLIESQKSIGAELDWRKKYEHIKHYYEKIPNQVSDKILDYINKLDLPFGAIDLIGHLNKNVF